MIQSFIQESESQRCRTIFLIGLIDGTNILALKARIATHLGRRFGGCFITSGMGAWADSGNDFVDDYSNSGISVEDSVRVELLTMPNQDDDAVNEVGRCLRQANTEIGTEIRFVLIEQFTTNARHIDLKSFEEGDLGGSQSVSV